jgi:integrase
MKDKLSSKFVANVKKPRRYGDGGGLVLVVTPSGTKNWQFRYERAGRERYMGLGALELVGLAEARDLALAARKQLLNRIDPMDARAEQRAREVQERRARITFADAARQYFDLHGGQWAAKHRGQFTATLETYAYPVVGALFVDSIRTEDVLAVIEPHWTTKTATMVRVRGRIEKVLAWCIVRGFRSAPNSAAWKGHLQSALPAPSLVAKPEHHPALPFAELPGFIATLRARQGFVARALEFTILCAARTGETVNARWSEIDFATATWTVPPERMKAGKEHKVPLSDPALALLRALPTESDFVFPGLVKNRPINIMAMDALRKRMGFNHITNHGFRSTFSDWAHHETNFPPHLIEMCLAHAVGSQVARAYRRGGMFDKRRALMEQWAAFCAGPPTAVEVVPLRKAVRS